MLFRGAGGVGGKERKDNWKPPKEYLKKHACKDKESFKKATHAVKIQFLDSSKEVLGCPVQRV